jgi:MGT family glycosyltransferase
MAKALFLGLPLHGHTNPSLPLVRALVERGEDVVYFSTEAFAAAIRAAGARFQPYHNGFLKDLRQLPTQTNAISWLLMRTTAEVLTDELDVFRAERPDYVIADSVAPWGQWVAQVLDVAVVTSVSTFVVNRHVLAFAATHGARPKSIRLVLDKIRHATKAALLGRRLRREHHVKGTGIMGLVYGQSDLNIVYTSRLFQPCADTFDDRFQFVGPSIGPRTENVSLLWDDASQTPVVYVSLGTLFNTDPAFYRNCFEAFGGQNVRVVMSIGANVTAAALGTPPPNVIVRPHVPQLEVLRRAAVFVSHGGMNSVSESLLHGVPLVCVPQMGEQEMVARRVEALGAGLYLAKSEVTADRLRESVQRVLDDDRFRRQAAVVRQSFEAAGGAARGADAILSFTSHLAPHQATLGNSSFDPRP